MKVSRGKGKTIALCGLVRSCILEPPPRFVCFAVEPRQLDLDLRRALGGLVARSARLDLGGSEPTQLLPEPGGSLGSGIDAGADRRLEPRGQKARPVEAGAESAGRLEKAQDQVGVERR